MADERRLRAVDDVDPIWRLWEQLPPQWRGPVIGEGIDNWRAISENGQRRLKLTGLPDTGFRQEALEGMGIDRGAIARQVRAALGHAGSLRSPLRKAV